MLLNEPVMVALLEKGQIVWQQAKIVGRTLEAEPHYDVRLEGGMIIARVPSEYLRTGSTLNPIQG